MYLPPLQYTEDELNWISVAHSDEKLHFKTLDIPQNTLCSTAFIEAISSIENGLDENTVYGRTHTD